MDALKKDNVEMQCVGTVPHSITSPVYSIINAAAVEIVETRKKLFLQPHDSAWAKLINKESQLR